MNEVVSIIEDDELEADVIFFEPPDCRTVSDEDSDEDDKNDLNKLSDNQLWCGAELE